MEITLPHRYRGPLTSANGGYACGRLAAFVDGDEVEVTLRLPPPLDRPLNVERVEDQVRLLDGEAIVAEGRAAPVEVKLPAAVSLSDEFFNISVLQKLGDAYMRLGKYKEAAKAYDDVSQGSIKALVPEATLGKAAAALALGDANKA